MKRESLRSHSKEFKALFIKERHGNRGREPPVSGYVGVSGRQARMCVITSISGHLT